MITVARILGAVGAAYGVEPGAIAGGGRCQPLAEARQLAMWLARRHTRLSLPEIAVAVGRRRHSATVLWGIEATARRLREDREFQLVHDLAAALLAGHSGKTERAALELFGSEAEIAAGLALEEIKLRRAANLQARKAERAAARAEVL